MSRLDSDGPSLSLKGFQGLLSSCLEESQHGEITQYLLWIQHSFTMKENTSSFLPCLPPSSPLKEGEVEITPTSVNILNLVLVHSSYVSHIKQELVTFSGRYLFSSVLIQGVLSVCLNLKFIIF